MELQGQSERGSVRPFDAPEPGRGLLASVWLASNRRALQQVGPLLARIRAGLVQWMQAWDNRSQFTVAVCKGSVQRNLGHLDTRAATTPELMLLLLQVPVPFCLSPVL